MLFTAPLTYHELTVIIQIFQVLLGKAGAEKVMPFGAISAFEQATLDAMIPDLVAQAKKGVEYVNKK